MKILRLAILAGALGAAVTCQAQTSNDQFMKRSDQRFGDLAGSSGNLDRLVTGLRTGNEITLRGDGEVVRFTPATKPMGYGNITRTLDFAKRNLAAEGITNPTPSQLDAALNGGKVVGVNGEVTLRGVLDLRASGMGWGQIAHTIGVHPGMGAPAQQRFATTSPSRATGAITTAGGGTITTGRANGNGRANAVTTNSGGGAGNGKGLATASSTAAGTAVGGGAAVSNAGGAGNGQGNAFGRSK